ncbi:hypothetical protein D9613_004817 [Agrocybe pediades]|uniref:Ribosomal RNA-processing protein 7 n=1 Tax=Agrocybe pediades TaxID=84607 RepID=A0A8H4QYA6_9AGAR|nr:hypothetical protein D9613_004817 [Agrocybe pediades]
MSLPTQISGFQVLPVLYKSSSAASSSKSKSSSSTTHYLYARAHAASSNSKSQLPEGRTLFLVNLPPDTTERELVLFFKNSGTVEKVIFDFEVQELTTGGDDTDTEDEDEDEEMNVDEPSQGQHKRGRKEKKPAAPTVTSLPSTPLRKLRKTGSSAYVIFLDASSLEKALSQSSSSKARPWPSSEEPIGLTHYLSLYNSLRPPLSAVREFADTSMALFEYIQAKNRLKKGKYNKGEAIVDEDGFTLVTRGGAYGKTLGGGVAVASKNFQRSGGKGGAGSGRHRKKKEKGEDGKDGFYAFQRAEKQRSGLLELKRKWEEDKAKVEKLKASRRFKPY